MAVSAPVPEPHSAAAAPGRHQEFAIKPTRKVGYRIMRAIFNAVLKTWFRPKVVGKEHVPVSGPVILAPVHRSFADFGFTSVCTRRKLFFMAKDSLWKNKWLGKLLLYLGVFPVHRESADREALQRAEEILNRGQCLVLFPEGTRREARRSKTSWKVQHSFRPARVHPLCLSASADPISPCPRGRPFPNP